MSEMNNEATPETPEAPETPSTSADPEAAPVAEGVLSKDEKMWGMLSHLACLIGSAVGGMTFLGPLIVYLIKKDESAFVADQSKEALNFQITFVIAIFALVILSMPVFTLIITTPLMMAAVVANIVFSIIGALKANEGEKYRYPFALRLVK